jgi:hypothetical protein
MSIPPQLWSFAETHQRFFETKECLAARDSPCAGPIVRAHIIPRSQLRQIAQRGHIVAVPTSLLAVMRMQQTKFEVKEIGIGEFSTMNCFCAGHDKTIFAPVEDKPLTLSPEQLALLHYRAITTEFYQRISQMESAAAALERELDEPRHFRSSWIFTSSSKAFEEAHDALDRTKKLIAARRFAGVSGLVVRFDTPPSVMATGAFRP